MKSIDILIAADKLLANEKTWVAGYFAVNKHGMAVSPSDEQACKWCLVGACRKVAGDPMQIRDREHSNLKAYAKVIVLLEKANTEAVTLTSLNDTQGFLAVKKLLRKAIKQA